MRTTRSARTGRRNAKDWFDKLKGIVDRYEEPPDGLVQIGDSPFYWVPTPEEGIDPADCNRWPTSPLCTNNPLDTYSLNVLGADADWTFSECSICFTITPVVGFVNYPPITFCILLDPCKPKDEEASPTVDRCADEPPTFEDIEDLDTREGYPPPCPPPNSPGNPYFPGKDDPIGESGKNYLLTIKMKYGQDLKGIIIRNKTEVEPYHNKNETKYVFSSTVMRGPLRFTNPNPQYTREPMSGGIGSSGAGTRNKIDIPSSPVEDSEGFRIFIPAGSAYTSSWSFTGNQHNDSGSVTAFERFDYGYSYGFPEIYIDDEPVTRPRPENPERPPNLPIPRPPRRKCMNCCDCRTTRLIIEQAKEEILQALSNKQDPLIKKIHDGLGVSQLPVSRPLSYLQNFEQTPSTTIVDLLTAQFYLNREASLKFYSQLGLEKLPLREVPNSFRPEQNSSVDIQDIAALQKLTYDIVLDFFRDTYKNLGVGDYPVSVPEKLLYSLNANPPQNIEIKSLAQYLTYIIKQIHTMLGAGSFPTTITVEDVDIVEEGNQSKDFPIPNMSEAILQSVAANISLQTDMSALINLCTSALIESGQTKQLAYGIDRIVRAMAEYLDFDAEEIEEDLPMSFTPNEKSLSKFLKESIQKIKVWNNKDKSTLSKALLNIQELLAVINGAFRRPLDLKGDVPKQIASLIKGAANLYHSANVTGEEPTKPDFDTFVERAEQGFTDAPSIQDPTKYYGRDYEGRPLIKDIDQANAESAGD